jgi:hypothetical protein
MGPEYEGVAVLPWGLLGSSPVLAAGGALAFETIFWEEPCDQLLPVFLVHISAALHSDL